MMDPDMFRGAGGCLTIAVTLLVAVGIVIGYIIGHWWH